MDFLHQGTRTKALTREPLESQRAHAAVLTLDPMEWFILLVSKKSGKIRPNSTRYIPDFKVENLFSSAIDLCSVDKSRRMTLHHPEVEASLPAKSVAGWPNLIFMCVFVHTI